MNEKNRREGTRHDTIHILNYICLDSDGRQVSQGMARSLNVSETGIKVETHEPIETRYIVFISIGVGEDIFDLKGKIIYCNRCDSGRFESGVEFYEIDFDLHSKLKHFIDTLEMVQTGTKKYV